MFQSRTVTRCILIALGARGASIAGLAAIALLGAPAARGQCTNFSMAQSSGAAIEPGTVDTGIHCDDCMANIAIPFPVTMYGVSYTAANISSNGNLQFISNNSDYGNACLPVPGTLSVAICPHWDDLLTNNAGEGVFTSLTGTAGQRVFNIEWRAHYYNGAGGLNFELRLFEDNSHFEVVFGQVDQGASSATIGVQDDTLPPTQFACNTSGLVSPGTRLTFTCYNGPSGTASVFPNPVYACGDTGTTLLTMNVIPGTNPPSTGIAVHADLRGIGGGADQVYYNDGTHGDAAANDGTWSFRFTVPPTVAPGDKSIPFTISDAQGRATGGSLGLTVNPCASTGPDVIVRGLTDVNYYGAEGGISAYSIGTDACNRGDFPAYWIQGGTQHPVIAQNMYRLKDGRFEQIGQSFLKHAFQSLNSPGCATCVQPPLGGAQLGVGCADVYGAGYNGGQGNLGRRSTTNATTGVFVWPPPPPPGNIIGQRLQVYTTDIDPALNQGAMYFGEAQYVTADDAQWTHESAPCTNGLNNASYQRMSFTAVGAAPGLIDVVHPMSPAIQAWKDVDPEVVLAAADYLDTSLSGPGIVCRFWVAARVSSNGNGTWHYEYAVHNLNADRAGGSFAVPMRTGAVISNIGFHGVFSHSGEPYPNRANSPDNWSGVAGPTGVTWNCPEPFAGTGDGGNAIRWGTMYNFRFDANIPPTTGAASIGLYKPGSPSALVAAGLPVPGEPCASDFNRDGAVDLFDYLDFVQEFSNSAQAADFNSDGIVDFFDYLDFVQAFATGC